MKFLKALQEDTGNNFSYLVPWNTVRIYMQQRGTLYPGVNCPPLPPPLNPHVCFHFYVMIKGLRRAWLLKVSESPSRGYWKQFLLSCLYEHSQNLPAVEWDTLPRGKVSPPSTLMYVFPSAQATVSHPTTELRWTLFSRLQHPTQQPS